MLIFFLGIILFHQFSAFLLKNVTLKKQILVVFLCLAYACFKTQIKLKIINNREITFKMGNSHQIDTNLCYMSIKLCRCGIPLMAET